MSALQYRVEQCVQESKDTRKKREKGNSALDAQYRAIVRINEAHYRQIPPAPKCQEERNERKTESFQSKFSVNCW